MLLIEYSRDTYCWLTIAPPFLQYHKLLLKARANDFNIRFKIRSILLNGNVESVCHPFSSSYIFFDIAQDTLKIGITDLHNFFVFRCIFDRQFFYSVVEIIIPFPPFFLSTALFSPFLDFYLHHTTLQKLQKRLISHGHCWKYHSRESLI